jgi:hypothetical protein
MEVMTKDIKVKVLVIIFFWEINSQGSRKYQIPPKNVSFIT